MPAIVTILALVILIALFTRRQKGVEWFDHLQDSAQNTLFYAFAIVAIIATFFIVFFVLLGTMGLD